jgi:S-adenosylmethionine:tRNA ribosyltransferase-isomerase
VVAAARAAGGRVVAVGTSATRALESAAADGVVGAASGWTHRVVTPAEPPAAVDGLITGWHDAQASHLQLIEAVAGTTLARRAYDAAGEAGYLWHEFGDSALLLPDRADPAVPRERSAAVGRRSRRAARRDLSAPRPRDNPGGSGT